MSYSVNFKCAPGHTHLHGVDDNSKGWIVPLAAALFASSSGSLSTAMDGADAEHAEDYHDDQEPHAHHDDDSGSPGNNCRREELGNFRERAVWALGAWLLRIAVRVK